MAKEKQENELETGIKADGSIDVAVKKEDINNGRKTQGAKAL